MTIVIPIMVIQGLKWFTVTIVIGLAIIGALTLYHIKDFKLWK